MCVRRREGEGESEKESDEEGQEVPVSARTWILLFCSSLKVWYLLMSTRLLTPVAHFPGTKGIRVIEPPPASRLSLAGRMNKVEKKLQPERKREKVLSGREGKRILRRGHSSPPTHPLHTPSSLLLRLTLSAARLLQRPACPGSRPSLHRSRPSA